MEEFFLFSKWSKFSVYRKNDQASCISLQSHSTLNIIYNGKRCSSPNSFLLLKQCCFPFDISEKLLLAQSIGTLYLWHKKITEEDLLSQENQQNGTEIILTLPFLLSRPFVMAFLWQAKTKTRGNWWTEQGGQRTGTALRWHPITNTWHPMPSWATCFSKLFKACLKETKV